MALNSGKLAGKTILISGASRGIGKAIALKAAQDGANIIIAAKTAQPHPKLPGTIYTAAKEIEDAGGKCLPCVVDIRSEENVQKCVDEAVRTYGGIDILVNNASAISLTGTLDTPMKTYDLMNSINARGTYLCSQACIPYLKQSQNPHILNISPPLSMKPVWFKNHTAYTIAKYGMSMCTLGMAEEFKNDGIAVNALWPRTAIATAAIEMIGGDALTSKSRKVEIMADAAYVILTRNSKSFTGQFAIDEDVLKEVGVTDLDQYSCVPGTTDLAPDYFLDSSEDFFTSNNISKVTKKPSATSSTDVSSVSGVINTIKGMLSEEVVASTGAVFLFKVSGDDGGEWVLDLKNGAGSVTKDPPSDVKVDTTMIVNAEDFVKLFTGKLDSMQAFMGGKMKVQGSIPAAMKMDKVMKGMRNKSKL